jgi:hypothetical protein
MYIETNGVLCCCVQGAAAQLLFWLLSKDPPLCSYVPPTTWGMSVYLKTILQEV